MGDDYELGFLGEFFQYLGEAADVALVQGGVHLVQDAEGAWLGLEYGEEERHGGHGFLSPGEEADRAEFLSRGLGYYLYPGLQDIRAFFQEDIGLPAAEEFAEHGVEVIPYLVEALLKEFLAGLADLFDDFRQGILGLQEVVPLGGEEVLPNL